MVRADLYEVVGAGLNVIGGLRHSAASLRIEALLRDAARFGVPRALDGRIDDADRLHGFGHAPYPDGDPRAQALLDRLANLDPPGDRFDTVNPPARRRGRWRGRPSDVDVALAAITFCANMPPGSGKGIFALARSAAGSPMPWSSTTSQPSCGPGPTTPDHPPNRPEPMSASAVRTVRLDECVWPW